MLAKCGHQYERRYVLGEIIPPGIGIIRGRGCHRGQEVNLAAKIETGEFLAVEAVRQAAADKFDEIARNESYRIDGDYEGMSVKQALGLGKDEAVELAGRHATHVAPNLDPTAVEIRIEVKPSASLPVTFVSVLDVVHANTIVIDTKTKRKSPSKDEADKAEQLTGQALAFAARYGSLPTEVRLQHLVRTPGRGELKSPEQVSVRTVGDVERFLRRCQNAVEVVRSEVFVPASPDAWWCDERYCGYAPTCKYYRGAKRPKN